MIIYDSKQQIITLGAEIGGGGEATVYQTLDYPDLLAKIYKGKPHNDYQEKLAWMQANPPQNPTQALGHASIAWPQDLLYSPEAEFVGYLMPYIHSAVSMLEAFNPRYRSQCLPGFNWQYLHRTAQNLANALEALHIYGYVVGDLNESNIMVTPSALVTLIDTDSFQIKIGHGNKTQVYRCPVGKPEYTPPELQGKSFQASDRLPQHDRFGLGILIFQLLMNGSHPFRAQWLGEGDPPSIQERIRLGCFPYTTSPNCEVRPPRHAVSLNILYPKLAELISDCFVGGHQMPRRRPSPGTWAKVLAEAEEALIICSEGHFYSHHLVNCPHCIRLGIKPQLIIPSASRQLLGHRAVVSPQTSPIIATPITTPASAYISPGPVPPSKPVPAIFTPRWLAGAIIVIFVLGGSILILLGRFGIDENSGIEPSSLLLPTNTSSASGNVPILMTLFPTSTRTQSHVLVNTPTLSPTHPPVSIPIDTPRPSPSHTPTIGTLPTTIAAINTPTVSLDKPRIFIILPQGDFYNQGDSIQVILAIQDPDGVGNVSWWVTDALTADVMLRNNHWCNHQVECVINESVSDLAGGTFNIFVAAFDALQNDILEEAQITVR